MAGDDPGHLLESRAERSGLSSLAWSVLLNGVLVAAFVVGVIPIVAIVHGCADLVQQSRIRSGGDWVAYGFAFTGLLLGAVFFAYAIKYYLSTVMVLLTTLIGVGPRNRSAGHATSNGGLTRINGGDGFNLDLRYHPLLSVHFAAHHRKRGVYRLLPPPSPPRHPEYTRRALPRPTP